MNILLIYDHYSPFPLRQAFADHLYSFKRYSDHQIYYCNYAYGIPNYLKNISFDLIVFHQFFAAQFRWCGLTYAQYTKRLAPLRKMTGKKVLLCQDEFFKMDYIAQFIKDYDIECIFSVAEESEWKKIYREVDRNKVRIYKVLTGYIDDSILKTIEELDKEPRSIDIGYRAWHAPAWLGRQGKLKVDVALHVREKAKAKSLQVDIATAHNEGAMFHGLDWYRFMLRCKAFVGVEGGSSLLDEKGEISRKVNVFLKNDPKASFEDIEKACFPGLDGNLNLVALSPRHLEACITRTCQILVEGEYSGILKPNIHYLPLKKDFSNLDDVLEKVQKEDVRRRLTENAYKDIVASRKYMYSSFVSELISHCFENETLPKSSKKHFLLFQFNRMRDKLYFYRIPFEFFLFRKIKKILPTSFIHWLKSFRNLGSGVAG